MPETTLGLLIRCADPACGLEFTPRTPWHKYHSARCRKRYWERVHGRRARSEVSGPSAGARRRKRRGAPRRWLLLIQF